MRDEGSKPSWLCGVLRLRQDELLIHGLIVRHTLTGRRRRSRTTAAKIMASIAKRTEAQCIADRSYGQSAEEHERLPKQGSPT